MIAFIKRNLIGFIALAVACAGFMVAEASATSGSDPVPTDREWQIEEYFNRMHAHAEAEKEYVDNYIAEIMALREASYKRDIAEYDDCVSGAGGPNSIYNRCLYGIASAFGNAWLHYELGINDFTDLRDYDFTAEQKVFILDWPRVKKVIEDNPQYWAGEYLKARQSFIDPPLHSEHGPNIHTGRDRLHPTLPLVSERPLHGITLLPGTLASTNAREGSFTINLQSRIPTAMVAKISTDTAGGRILNSEVSWEVDEWQEYRTIQIGKLPTSDVFPNSITATVKIHPKGEPTNILFTETVTVSTE